MDKLLDFLLKNIKTNFKEVVLISSVVAVIYFYKQDKEFFTQTLEQHITDKLFYRHKADSVQKEYNQLQDEVLKSKEEELRVLRESNRLLDKALNQ